jgi:hypothetical protein
LGRICGGAPFVANPQSPPKTGGGSFGSFLRGACRTRRQLFSHPFFGALIKKGIRLWVINHYNGFVMHGLIPNCFYTNQGRRTQCKTGPQRRGKAVQEGLSGAGCPSRTAKNIKKQNTSKDIAQGSFSRPRGASAARKKTAGEASKLGLSPVSPRRAGQRTVSPRRRGGAAQDGLSAAVRPSHTSKNIQKHRPKHSLGELFEASGRVSGGTLFLANH